MNYAGRTCWKARAVPLQIFTLAGRSTSVFLLVPGAISLKANPQMRVAVTAVRRWDTAITGAAIANAARHAVGSSSAVAARMCLPRAKGREYLFLYSRHVSTQQATPAQQLRRRTEHTAYNRFPLHFRGPFLMCAAGRTSKIVCAQIAGADHFCPGILTLAQSIS